MRGSLTFALVVITLVTLLGLGAVSCSSPAGAQAKTGWVQIEKPPSCRVTEFFPSFEDDSATDTGDVVVCANGTVWQAVR